MLVVDGVLRSEVLYNELREAVRRTRRDDFRIVELSVQRDHVHMQVEAESAGALAAGMKGFAVRAARRINSRVLRRRGSVWGAESGETSENTRDGKRLPRSSRRGQRGGGCERDDR